MEHIKVIRQCRIEKCAFDEGYDGSGVFLYSAEVDNSIDGGKTFWHCGEGRYCKTLVEAQNYKASIDAAQA